MNCECRLNPRQHLPDERKGKTHKAVIGTTDVYITANTDDRGNIKEIWIKIGKEGERLRAWDVVAHMISIGLQYGNPIEAYIEALKYVKMSPAGVTKNKRIKIAHSIADYLGKWLEMKVIVERKQGPQEP